MCAHVTPGSLALMALSRFRMGLDAWERGVCNRGRVGGECAPGERGVWGDAIPHTKKGPAGVRAGWRPIPRGS